MKHGRKWFILITILMFSLTGFAVSFQGMGSASRAADSPSSEEGGSGVYISDVMIAAGASEDEVVDQIKKAGYIPVIKNIADEKPELASPYVYLGYKTTTDPSEAMENKQLQSTGSVFGESALMIAGFTMIIGVLIGMISMRIRPGNKKERDSL